jgi:hypothetical protein
VEESYLSMTSRATSTLTLSANRTRKQTWDTRSHNFVSLVPRRRTIRRDHGRQQTTNGASFIQNSFPSHNINSHLYVTKYLHYLSSSIYSNSFFRSNNSFHQVSRLTVVNSTSFEDIRIAHLSIYSPPLR